MESQDEITTTPQNNLSDNNSEEDTSPKLNSVDNTSRSHPNNSVSENTPPVLFSGYSNNFSQDRENEKFQNENIKSNSNNQTEIDLFLNSSFISFRNEESSLQAVNCCKSYQHFNESTNNVAPQLPVNNNLLCKYMDFTNDSFVIDSNVKRETEVGSLKQLTQDYLSNVNQALDDCHTSELEQNQDPTTHFNFDKSKSRSSVSSVNEYTKNIHNKLNNQKFKNETQNYVNIETNLTQRKKGALSYSTSQRNNIKEHTIDNAEVINNFTTEPNMIFLENNEISQGLSKHESATKRQKLNFHTDETENNSRYVHDINPFASFRGFGPRKVETENKDTVRQFYNATTSKCNVKQSVAKLNEITDFPDIEKGTENFEADQIFQKNREETLKLHKVKFTCVDKHSSFKSNEMVESFSNNVTDNSNSSVKLENKETSENETRLKDIVTQSNDTCLESLKIRPEEKTREQQNVTSSTISNNICYKDQKKLQFSYDQSNSHISKQQQEIVNLLEDVNNEIILQSTPIEHHRTVTDMSNEFESLNSPEVKTGCSDRNYCYRNSTELLHTISLNDNPLNLENSKMHDNETFKNNRFIEENISVYNMKGEERSLSNANGTFDKGNVKTFTTPEFMSNEAKSNKLKDVKCEDESQETRKRHFNHHSTVNDKIAEQYGVLNNNQLQNTLQDERTLYDEYLKITNKFFESYGGFPPNISLTTEIPIKTDAENGNENLLSRKNEAYTISEEEINNKSNLINLECNGSAVSNLELDDETLDINYNKNSTSQNGSGTIESSLDKMKNTKHVNSPAIFNTNSNTDELNNFDNVNEVEKVSSLLNQRETNNIIMSEHNYSFNSFDINNSECKFENLLTIPLLNSSETDANENNSESRIICNEETNTLIQHHKIKTNNKSEINNSKKNENTDNQPFLDSGCKNKLEYVFSNPTVIYLKRNTETIHEYNFKKTFNSEQLDDTLIKNDNAQDLKNFRDSSTSQNIIEEKKQTTRCVDSQEHVEKNISFDQSPVKETISVSDTEMSTEMNMNNSNISYTDVKSFNISQTLNVDSTNKGNSLVDENINSTEYILKSSGELVLNNSESSNSKQLNKCIDSPELIQMTENRSTNYSQNFTFNLSGKHINFKDTKLRRIPFVKLTRLTDQEIRSATLNPHLNISINNSKSNSEYIDSRQSKHTLRSNDEKCSLPSPSAATQHDYKNKASCENNQSTSFSQNFQTIRKGDFISMDNSNENMTSSSRTKTSRNKSITKSDVQLSHILQRYSSATPGTSTSSDYDFGPKRFIGQTTKEQPGFSFKDSTEFSSFSSNIFDYIMTAIKELNCGNGCCVPDILAYVRRNSSSTTANLSYVRKVLKNAAATGLIHYTNGKYIIKRSFDSTDTLGQKSAKRKMDNTNDSKNRLLSKKVKPTPRLRCSKRIKTTRPTRKTARK
ncbi:uncharacterized protein TNIN_260341 [Trichonephila inaurata madagascariensis]|uniref:H15 domain-containing protein n=1 Tax=Trichonephila inaurata madagascariensis TaxID=2747483 RepID=A0A8X7BVQ3_9ARAC|nr:uncharacterized protein TNIN_260341 [Trichonephila inaurata madagascariensis]